MVLSVKTFNFSVFGNFLFMIDAFAAMRYNQFASKIFENKFLP